MIITFNSIDVPTGFIRGPSATATVYLTKIVTREAGKADQESHDWFARLHHFLFLLLLLHIGPHLSIMHRNMCRSECSNHGMKRCA